MRRDSLSLHLSGPRCQWQSRGRLRALSPSISSFLSFVTVTIIADSAAPPPPTGRARELSGTLFLRRPPSGRRLKVIPFPSSVPSKSYARPPPRLALPRPDERQGMRGEKEGV